MYPTDQFHVDSGPTRDEPQAMDKRHGRLRARAALCVRAADDLARESKTVLFVTHGIAEAVFLGTRVVVLTAGPAGMAADIEIELPRPRTPDLKTDARFGEYTRRIYHLLGLE